MNNKIYLYSAIFLIIDQVSKIFFATILSLSESLPIIKNFLSFTYINNYGAAFGILNDKGTFLIILSLVALIIIYRQMYVFKKNKRNIISLSLIMAGILGNLIDRLFLGYVRDFIDIKIFSYNFPVFNIADCCVVIGVFLLIIAIFKGEDKHENSSVRVGN